MSHVPRRVSGLRSHVRAPVPTSPAAGQARRENGRSLTRDTRHATGAADVRHSTGASRKVVMSPRASPVACRASLSPRRCGRAASALHRRKQQGRGRPCHIARRNWRSPRRGDPTMRPRRSTALPVRSQQVATRWWSHSQVCPLSTSPTADQRAGGFSTRCPKRHRLSLRCWWLLAA